MAQLDINTQFTLFFPERRPFFLDGADFFRTPFNTVFTRNVARPDWGVRLTGKLEKNGIGVFVAEDSITNLVFPGSTESDSDSFDFGSSSAALRDRRDFGDSSSVGLLFTGREGSDYRNPLGGIDGLYRFRESDFVRFQMLGSESRYPDDIADEYDQPAGGFEDWAWLVSYVHEARNLAAWLRHEDVGSEFRADLGFMPRVDYRETVAGLERHWWGDGEEWFTRISVGWEASRARDQLGRLLEEEYDVWGFYQGPLQTSIWPDLATRDEVFDGVRFDRDFLRSWFTMQPSGDFRFEIFARVGDQIDFDNTRPADEVFLRPEIQVNLGLRLRTDLSHTHQRLDVDEGRLFEAGLSQLRVVYQLKLRTFVRAIVQYSDIERNPSLYLDEEVNARTEELFTQLLFSYKLNPRTVVFVGYSDSRAGDQSVDLTQEDRTFFLKLGYSWVF